LTRLDAIGDFGLRRRGQFTIKTRMRLPALVLLAVLCLAPGLASAHAIVMEATPPVGAVVRGPALHVLLRFNSRIDHQRSRLTLIRGDGSNEPVTIADSDGPSDVAAMLDGLTPGKYRLRWQVLAIDGHITRGDIPFTVAP
jgi:methionine-rich copper-binding protein CopC